MCTFQYLFTADLLLKLEANLIRYNSSIQFRTCLFLSKKGLCKPIHISQGKALKKIAFFAVLSALQYCISTKHNKVSNVSQVCINAK